MRVVLSERQLVWCGSTPGTDFRWQQTLLLPSLGKNAFGKEDSTGLGLLPELHPKVMLIFFLSERKCILERLD